MPPLMLRPTDVRAPDRRAASRWACSRRRPTPPVTRRCRRRPARRLQRRHYRGGESPRASRSTNRASKRRCCGHRGDGALRDRRRRRPRRRASHGGRRASPTISRFCCSGRPSGAPPVSNGQVRTLPMRRAQPRFAVVARARAVAAALTVAHARGGPRVRAAQAQSDGVTALLRHLEAVLEAGDPAGLSHTTSPIRPIATARASLRRRKLLPEATRSVIQERDREPLAGTLPGEGYRLLRRRLHRAGHARAHRDLAARREARRRAAQPGELDEWRIADEDRMNVGREPVPALAQSDEAVRRAQPDDRRGGSGAERSNRVRSSSPRPTQGVTGVVLIGRGEMRLFAAVDDRKGAGEDLQRRETARDALRRGVHPDEPRRTSRRWSTRAS